ncbi:MAG: DUF6268 family outer membrane beta-barrel protein [Candidatus Omnitrophica bacterium]|nr:DUF6268 family outer membrane beta-barrel protein [Candidatus Omnitrophota bacterium]
MKRNLSAIIAVLLFFCANVSVAGENTQEDAFRNEADVYIEYTPDIYSTGGEYSYEYKLFDKLPITFSVGSDSMFIDKKGPVSLPAHLVALTTDVETILPLFGLKGAYIGAGISPSFYSDEWDFEASAFRLPSRGFLVYQPDDKWTLIGGVAVFPKLKYPVWPIFGVIYKPVKELTFNLVADNPNIVYALNDRISLFAEGNFTYDEYEVDRGAAKDVILRYEDITAGGGLEFKFSKFTKAVLTAGGIFDRSMKYRDGGGKVDIDAGFYTGLRLMSEF